MSLCVCPCLKHASQDVVHATPHLDDPNSGDIFFFDVSVGKGGRDGSGRVCSVPAVRCSSASLCLWGCIAAWLSPRDPRGAVYSACSWVWWAFGVRKLGHQHHLWWHHALIALADVLAPALWPDTHPCCHFLLVCRYFLQSFLSPFCSTAPWCSGASPQRTSRLCFSLW